MAATVPAILEEGSVRFYREAMTILETADVPFLVGGAYAFARYTGIERHTKDFDLFIRRADFERAAWAFRKQGMKTELKFTHWLGKVWQGDSFVDLIFSAGNGVATVDELWFDHAVAETVFGHPVRLIPAEEMIWSKGLIMERERYDGADVAHIIQARADQLDWGRLVRRFGPHWRVLLSHLVLFGFIYPSERSKVPSSVLSELMERMQQETEAGDDPRRVCNGTLISRQQYLPDISARGYEDARRTENRMSDDEIEQWTAGIAVDGANG